MLAEIDGDGIGRLVFNNPTRHNALSLEMWQGLVDALEHFEENDNVRVVVMSSTGGRSFVSGADISEFDSKRSNVECNGNTAACQVGHALATFSSRSSGRSPATASAGGLATTLNADIRFATPDSTFGIPAAKLGLGYGYDGLAKLARTRRAKSSTAPDRATTSAKDHILSSVERSLSRLRSDRIEIVLVHSDGRDVSEIEPPGAFRALARLQRKRRRAGRWILGQVDCRRARGTGPVRRVDVHDQRRLSGGSPLGGRGRRRRCRRVGEEAIRAGATSGRTPGGRDRDPTRGHQHSRRHDVVRTSPGCRDGTDVMVGHPRHPSLRQPQDMLRYVVQDHLLRDRHDAQQPGFPPAPLDVELLGVSRNRRGHLRARGDESTGRGGVFVPARCNDDAQIGLTCRFRQ